MAHRPSQHDADIRFAVLAADVVLFTVRDGELYTRLIPTRGDTPYPGMKAFPGGLIRAEEMGKEAAARHLETKAGVSPTRAYMEQLFTFTKIDRDPRGRVVAIGYLALVPWEDLSEEERVDTEKHWWVPVVRAKGLAYDHDEILQTALLRLRSRITYTTLISKLLPEEFTLTELEKLYEAVLGKGLDKRNFRKKILKLKVLKKLPRMRRGGRFRPAQLYSFASKTVKDIEVL